MYEYRCQTQDEFTVLIESLENRQLLAENPNNYSFDKKLEFAKRILNHQINGQFEPQMCAILNGMSEIIPLNVFSIIQPDEIERIVCGQV